MEKWKWKNGRVVNDIKSKSKKLIVITSAILMLIILATNILTIQLEGRRSTVASVTEEVKLTNGTTKMLAPNTENLTDYSVKKQWSDMTDEEAKNYKSTFKLQKKVGTNFVDVDTPELEIIGNDTKSFTNIPRLDDEENEIEYIAVETKIEKTEDNGTSWTVVPENDYRVSYKKRTRLADLAQVGDYVDYSAYTEEEHTYSVTQEVSGSPYQKPVYSNQTDEVKNMKWRVLKADAETGIVELMAEETIEKPKSGQRLAFQGITGALNYSNLLNDISSIYGYGNGATLARSINENDLDQYSSYEKSNYKHTESGGGSYGDTKTFTSGTFVDSSGNQVVATSGEPYTETLTGYKYAAKDYFEDDIYNMLFKKASDTNSYKSPYYVAYLSRLIFKNLAFVNYSATEVTDGYINGYFNDSVLGQKLVILRSNAPSGNSASFGHIMPVVQLKTDMLTKGKDENGVWQLSLDENGKIEKDTTEPDLTVTNSVIPKSTYEVHYYYNGEEKEEYKFTSDRVEIGTEIEDYTDRVERGFELDKVTTKNGGNLPLVIQQNAEENIINVYYKTKYKTLKVQKEWNVADSNNYKSTFVLKRINGNTTEVVTDGEENPVTQELIGNGIATFEGLIAYDETSEIRYTAEEIKTEKKNAQGEWEEINASNYYTKHNTTASGVVKPGDYVAYSPVAGGTYTAESSKTGTTSATFTVEDGTKWRVLKTDEETGKTYIILDGVLETQLALKGEAGFLNAKEILNNIAQIYATGEGAISGRSLTLDDFEKYSVYDKTQYTYGPYHYGQEKQYNTGEFYLEDGTRKTATSDDMVNEKYTFYEYVDIGNDYFISDEIYNTIFKDGDLNVLKDYWMQDYGVKLNNSAVDYWQFIIQDTGLYGIDLVNTIIKDGVHTGWEGKAYVRPVIELSSSMVVTGKDENGVWILRNVEEESNADYINITSSALRNYEIKQEWNINDYANYKTTFTLYRKYPNGLKEVTDRSGNVMTAAISGEETAVFENIPEFDGETKIEYVVKETKVERKVTNEDGESEWEELPLKWYTITYQTSDDYDEVIKNEIIDKIDLFSLNNISNLSNGNNSVYLPNVKFTISIIDETDENNLVELVDQEEEYITDENGNITIANWQMEDLPQILITNENQKFKITIKMEGETEGYKAIEEEIVAHVSVKLNDDGERFVLVFDDENLEEENTYNEIHTKRYVTILNKENEEEINGKVEIDVAYREIIINVINFWKTGYTVNYLEDGTDNELHDSKVNTIANYGTKISGNDEIIEIPGYEFEKVSVENLILGQDKDENVINVYYTKSVPYGVWVNGKQLTMKNSFVRCGNGIASFDVKTNTLTLNNTAISNYYEYQPYRGAVIYSTIPELTINVIGDNKIQPTSTFADGIALAENCNVTLAGTGTLAMNKVSYAVYAQPDGQKKVNSTLSMEDGMLDITPTVAGTNIKNFIMGDNLEYEVGTSLLFRGHIVIRGMIFKDLVRGEWYVPYVKYVFERNLMTGYTDEEHEDMFGINDQITRGQVVTILYRMAESPEVSEESIFSDVTDEDEYYYKAVLWAAENGIVTGYKEGENAGKFLPNKAITREELAVVLQRYARLQGKYTSKTAELSKFADAESVSDWAEDSLKWTVAVGIISGNKDTEVPTIKPQGNATRAEAATMIMRFCENVF